MICQGTKPRPFRTWAGTDQKRAFADIGPSRVPGLDRNLSFQNKLSQFSIAVVVLKAQSIRLVHTRPLMTKVLALLPSLKPGQVVIVTP